MTRQSSIERAARLEGKPGLACIGRFFVNGESVDFPYAEEDLARDATFWASVLRGYGIERGRRAVISALSLEMPWTQAVRMGTTLAGGTYSNVEFWGWDARRLDLFVRRAQPHALIGPGRELLESLGGIAELPERLSGVPVVLVRPDAVEILEEAGVRPAGIVVPLGPAVAVSMPDGSGLGFDESEWDVDDEDGELLVSVVGARAAKFERQRTGARGRVERTSAGPRIILEE